MNTAYHAGMVQDQRRFRLLMWIFCFSFVLDYRGERGGPPVQLLFLGVALAAGGLALLTSLRYLRVRPGIYLILLWWGYLASTVVVALAGDAEFSRYLRVVIPYGLCGMGLVVAHVAAVRGIKVQEIVMAVLAAAVINVFWRGAFGFVFHGVTVETVRVEILSPAINWLMAYLGVGLLLRDRFSPFLLVIMGVCGSLIFLSVTRGTLLPPFASGMACLFCLVLAVYWRVIPLQWAAGKVLRLSLLAFVLAGGMGLFALSQPEVLDRWDDRLFHHAGDATSKDISLLTREAEATGIWEGLTEVPLRVLYGKGMGASYYWNSAYFPEIYQVYDVEDNLDAEIWFAGHSTWTFALFSGGVIGLLCILGFILSVMWLSLRSVHRNAAFPGFRVDLAFLPFVAAMCLFSESVTSNPFDERLAGLLFGVMAGIPQFFFVRAYALRRSAGRPVVSNEPQRVAEVPVSEVVARSSPESFRP